MRIVLALFSAVLFIAFADAQRKLNMTKQVVNIEKRPRPPVWNPPTEERRKLSIFPNNNMKFVVTPKTVVENDDTAKEGLPTKRNDKGTWSFAPREPLMKTNRFMVTLAPPRSNRKEIDEMESKEAKKVNTTRNAKIGQPSIKNHNLNKRNLIDTMQIKKTKPHASKNLEMVENELNGEELSEITKVNDSQNFDIIQMNDNSRSKSDKESKDYSIHSIDIRSLDDEVVILNVNETKNESENKHGSLNFNQASTLDTELSKNFTESRVVDLNELEYVIKQNENNVLTTDNEESNNYNTAQILSFNDLEILLEKIVNNTESSAADFNEINPSNSAKNEINGTVEDIKFDVTKPNQFYDVIPLSSDEDKNTNIEQDFLTGSIQHGAQIIEKNEKPTVGEIIILNGEEGFTENVPDYLVVGNLESHINFMDNENAGVEKPHQEMKTNTKYTITEKPLTNNVTNDEIIHTEFPKELNSNDTDSLEEIILVLEMYESNISLSSEELSADVVDEILDENVNLSGLEILNEPFNDSVSVDEILNESISGTSNNYNEERSNESLVDTLTDEEISNESSSIMAGEELSNESSSLIAEISNEYSIESSNNYSGEVISNESSSNEAGEVISNESDKSYNLTEEISSEATVETSHRLIDEEISEGSLIDDSVILTDVQISDKSAESSQEPEIPKGGLINRFKRSNNIIEEEKLPTTVSGFKYTGNEVTLNHDLSYKNINA